MPELRQPRSRIAEVKAFVRKGDRIQKGPGMTDDLVMAMAGAQKVRAGIKRKVPREPMVEAIFPYAERRDAEHNWHKIPF